VLERGEAGFDEARAMWNARFGRSPDLIALCTSAEDVKSSVDFAREHRLQLSVKGCGHSYAANSVADGGLLIDLGSMKSIEVDVPKRTVTVGAGVTCGELDAATQAYGLATPTPTVSSVGVIGAALGGDSGWKAAPGLS
jgi:FAD/FMN-containing dehydrogenase